MTAHIEDLTKLKTKLRNLEKEHSEIKGELSSIDKQLEDIGIGPEDDIDDWIDKKKEELVKMRKHNSNLIERINDLLQQYEEEED